MAQSHVAVMEAEDERLDVVCGARAGRCVTHVADGAIALQSFDFALIAEHLGEQAESAMTDEMTVIGALDPNGFRPLSLGKMKNGAYVLASETCALDVVGAELVRNIRPGEIVVVNDHGYKIVQYTNNTQLAICSMEYIYFARPDSDIYGVNVHSARKRMGARLAAESPVEADMVIGVPNSSLSAASGYAEAAGLPNEMGLIKNQYVARTFIQPTQELREQGVRMKLSAVRSVVKGKRVIVIDDSIVRGTTSKRIVQLLKEAGAAEVPLLLWHRYLHHQGTHRSQDERGGNP